MFSDFSYMAGHSRYVSRIGAKGEPYGKPSLDILYLGSGGGSGGNSKDLAFTPRGM